MSKTIFCSHATSDERYEYAFFIRYEDAETGTGYNINRSALKMVGLRSSGLNYSCGINGQTSLNITGVACDFNLDGLADDWWDFHNLYSGMACSAQNHHCMGTDLNCDSLIDVGDTGIYGGGVCR